MDEAISDWDPRSIHLANQLYFLNLCFFRLLSVGMHVLILLVLWVGSGAQSFISLDNDDLWEVELAERIRNSRVVGNRILDQSIDFNLHMDSLKSRIFVADSDPLARYAHHAKVIVEMHADQTRRELEEYLKSPRSISGGFDLYIERIKQQLKRDLTELGKLTIKQAKLETTWFKQPGNELKLRMDISKMFRDMVEKFSAIAELSRLALLQREVL